MGGLAVGVCGTDKEIVRGEYGWAPSGRERLVLGHESLGRVHRRPVLGGLINEYEPNSCASQTDTLQCSALGIMAHMFHRMASGARTTSVWKIDSASGRSLWRGGVRVS